MFYRKLISILFVLLIFSGCSTNRLESSGDVSVELAPSVPNYVLFDLDSAQLNQQAIDSLNKQIDWLKGNPNINIVIEGHCDERGTREYNLALGAKRANTVKSYLISFGIKQSRVSTISYGKERPPFYGSNEEIWAKNRRAITYVN